MCAQTSADDLLLNNDGTDPNLRFTATSVVQDHFVPGFTTYDTMITDVKYCIDRLRTDEAISSTISVPLVKERIGVEWDEYNLLVSGQGFSNTGVYPFGKQQGQGRYLNLRVQVPRNGWNGKLIYWHHGSASIHTHAFTPLLEPELMHSRGFALANATFSGPAPEQQNPNTDDGSFWSWIFRLGGGLGAAQV